MRRLRPWLIAAVLVVSCAREHERTGDGVAHDTAAIVPGIEVATATRAAVQDVHLAPASVMGDAEPAEVRDALRALVEAEARARAATEQAARLDALARGAIAPRRELEAARADAAAAGAAADRARQTLAAFGTAAEQRPLAAGERWVLAQVPQRDVAGVAAGAAVTFRADGFPGREFAGTVDANASYVDPATRTAPVRTRVSDEAYDLRPGMSGSLAIVVGAPHDGVVVPAAAVVYDGAQPVLFTRTDGGAFVPRAVRLGVAAGGQVEILDGIEPGTTVATTGAASLLSSTRLPAEAD